MDEVELRLSGEVDIAVSAELRARVAAASADPRSTRLVLDLAEVTLLDASAMAVVVEAARRYAEVELRNASPQTRRTLDLVHLDEVTRIT